MKHTPGPWEVLNNYIKVRGGAVIATTARNNSVCNFAAGVASLEDAANARLIAAAPVTIEMLKDACNLLEGAAAWLEACGQPMVGNGLREWVAEKGRPAIQEAEGGRP